MKLIERIRAGLVDWNQAHEYMHEIMPVLFAKESDKATPVCVDIQNVFEWVHSLQADFYTIPTMCVKGKLPFFSMWTEFEQPILIRHDNDESTEDILEVGVLTVEDHFKGSVTVGGVKTEAINLMFLFDRRKRSETRANFMGIAKVFLDENHQGIAAEHYQPGGSNEDGAGVEFDHDHEISDFIPTMSALSFFHCKNVELKTKAPNIRKANKFIKKYHTAPAVWNVIHVHRLTKKYLEKGPGNKRGALIGASMIRGHFKKYTSDAPLLGKHVGMYFWQSHVRGSGVPTAHDYKVHEPKGKHRKECVIQ